MIAIYTLNEGVFNCLCSFSFLSNEEMSLMKTLSLHIRRASVKQANIRIICKC